MSPAGYVFESGQTRAKTLNSIECVARARGAPLKVWVPEVHRRAFGGFQEQGPGERPGAKLF